MPRRSWCNLWRWTATDRTHPPGGTLGRQRLLQAGTIEEQNRLSASMRIRQLVPEVWCLHVTPTLILLGYLARYYRRADLTPANLKIAPTHRSKPRETPQMQPIPQRT